MPKPKPGENRNDFVARCVKEVVNRKIRKAGSFLGEACKGFASLANADEELDDKKRLNK